jgi:hypothetical protein
MCAGLRIATFPELTARESRSSSAYNFIKQMPTNFDRRAGTSATSGVEMPSLLSWQARYPALRVTILSDEADAAVADGKISGCDESATAMEVCGSIASPPSVLQA